MAAPSSIRTAEGGRQERQACFRSWGLLPFQPSLSEAINDFHRREIMNKLKFTAILAGAALALSPASVAAQEGPPMQLKPHAEGAEVAIMQPNGPAASLGLKVGDIILEVGGKPITREVLQEYMQSKKDGEPVSFKVKRAGAIVEVTGKVPAPPQG
jgi:S1-C subfamily serine protease